MALYFSGQSGALTSGSTWRLIDLNSTVNPTTVFPTYVLTTFVTSSAFTVATSSIEAIAIQINENFRANCSMSVRLERTGSPVAGTTVHAMLNSDIPPLQSYFSRYNTIWSVFKFPSPVTLDLATNYNVSIACEIADQVRVCSFTSGSRNWMRALITTTTGAPISGSDLIICGAHNSQNNTTQITVTANEISGSEIDYGSGNTNVRFPAIAVTDGGILQFPTTISSSHALKCSGRFDIGPNGTFKMGTQTDPIPSSSLAILTLDASSIVSTTLLYAQPGSTISTFGSPQTLGNSTVRCNISESTLNPIRVDRVTGWNNGAVIGISTSTLNSNLAMSASLISPATGSFIHFTPALNEARFASSEYSNRRTEVVLLNRNVKIYGTSVGLPCGNVELYNSYATMSWTEFRYVGSGNGSSLQIQGTQSISITNCSFRDSKASNAAGIIASNLASNYYIENCIMYGMAGYGITINNNNDGFRIMSCSIINCANGINLLSSSGSVKYTYCGSLSGGGIGMTSNQSAAAEISDIQIISAAGGGLTLTKGVFNITSCSIWNMTNYGIQLATSTVGSFKSIVINTTGQYGVRFPTDGYANICISNMSCSGVQKGINLENSQYSNVKLTVLDSHFNSNSHTVMYHPTESSTQAAVPHNISFRDTNFHLGYTTAQAYFGNFSQNIKPTNIDTTVTYENCQVFAHNPIYEDRQTMTTMASSSYSIHEPGGTVAISPTDGILGNKCLALLPYNSTVSIDSNRFKFPVSASQIVTASLYVKKSNGGNYITTEVYNGNSPTIVLKSDPYNYRMTDSIVYTITTSSGNWENAIIGLPISSRSMVYELVVSCTGTSGSVFVDNVTAIIG